jgi:hypothetical protein
MRRNECCYLATGRLTAATIGQPTGHKALMRFGVAQFPPPHGTLSSSMVLRQEEYEPGRTRASYSRASILSPQTGKPGSG